MRRPFRRRCRAFPASGGFAAFIRVPLFFRKKENSMGFSSEPVSGDAAKARLSASGRPLSKNWLAIIAFIWAGQAVSMFTSYAASFAAVWYVTETTGSAVFLSAMSICAYLPQGLLSPYGGVIADRCNRKTVIIAADMAVGLVSVSYTHLDVYKRQGLYRCRDAWCRSSRRDSRRGRRRTSPCRFRRPRRRRS